VTEKCRIFAEELSIVQTWAGPRESGTTGCVWMESPPRSPPQNSTPALGSSEKLQALEQRRSICNREGSNSRQTSEMEPQAVDQQARKIQAILRADQDFKGFLDITRGWTEYQIVRRICKFSMNIVASFFLLALPPRETDPR
jgi:hypothetical protein